MTKKVLDFDILILGGGPAGLSAGVYAARGAVKAAIVDISMFGGQPSNYLEIENYIGFPLIGGYDLAEKFEEHADKFGVEKFPMQEIQSIDLVSTPKIVETLDYRFEAKTVIIAAGARFKKLGIKGEKELTGLGVSYCAVCDGAFFKDKEIAVIGGGNTAVEEGIYLTRFAKKVYIINRRDKLKADKILQNKAMSNDKIEILYNVQPKEILGDKKVSALEIENLVDGSTRKIDIEGVFPFIGLSPNVDLINGQLKQDENGFIITDENMQTSIEGVFAVGDIRTTPLRQVITAAADGTIGAVNAIKYIEHKLAVELK